MDVFVFRHAKARYLKDSGLFVWYNLENEA
jgi:hypothetical protein